MAFLVPQKRFIFGVQCPERTRAKRLHVEYMELEARVYSAVAETPKGLRFP